MNYELFIIIILCIAVTFLVLRLSLISKSIKEVSQFLKELSSGNLEARLFPKGNRGIDNIVKELAYLMDKTKTRLDFLEAETQRMDAILRGMSDGVLITDVRGVVILANQSFRGIVSMNEDIEGRQIMEVLRNTSLIGIFKNAIESKHIVSEEITISRPYTDMHLIATAIPVYSNADRIKNTESFKSEIRDSKCEIVSGVVLTLHDITRLKQLEEMRKDFVANVSHEIKTPLTAIRGFAETLLDGAMDDKENSVRFLSMIKSHSERLNSLVDDLLILSRIELGDININKIDVNFEQVIDTVFMTLKEKADRKGLYLKKIISDRSQMIRADRDKLIQIILNLVDNGIKFTERGGVTVGLDELRGKLTIYVQDTGIGIPQNHLHRLGERFYRVDMARSRELGGTGLGLAIVKHLVNAHEWDMIIESEIGKGTRVNILM